MSDSSARTFSTDFRRFFVRGLVVLLPTVLTLWIVVAAYQFVESRFAEPINRGVRISMNMAAPYWSPLTAFDPDSARIDAVLADRGWQERRRTTVRNELRQQNIDAWWAERWYMNLIGLIIAIVGVYIAGRLLGGFFGRTIYRRLEGLITSLPVFKQVYPYVKQIVDFLFSDEPQMKFSRVVVTEYPRKGIWSVGFQTGPPMRTIAERAGDSVTIFIPSSPTPFTGYTITVPREDVIGLPITVDEAIRFALSGGVLVPDHQSYKELIEQRASSPEHAPRRGGQQPRDEKSLAKAAGRAGAVTRGGRRPDPEPGGAA